MKNLARLIIETKRLLDSNYPLIVPLKSGLYTEAVKSLNVSNDYIKPLSIMMAFDYVAALEWANDILNREQGDDKS